jgi:single-strand DNA-binding protein
LFRSTAKGTPLCTFSIASNRYYKQDSGLENEVSFFDVESWSKIAESCFSLGHKGRGVKVVGRLKQDRWSGSDGKQRSKVMIVAEHVEFRPDFRHEESVKEDAPNPGGLADAAASSEAESDSYASDDIYAEDINAMAEATF